MSGSAVLPGAQGKEVDAFHFQFPADFQAPMEWQGQQCTLVPASPRWVALDYAAVMASREHLQGLFGAGDAWPPADLTQADDKADLAWHKSEFVRGKSFAYSLLSLDLQRCLGCLYMYPTASPAHGAEAYLWTASTESEPLRAAVTEEVMQWLANDWPLTTLAWPGRSIPFAEWPYCNYYAERRHTSSGAE